MRARRRSNRAPPTAAAPKDRQRGPANTENPATSVERRPMRSDIGPNSSPPKIVATPTSENISDGVPRREAGVVFEAGNQEGEHEEVHEAEGGVGDGQGEPTMDPAQRAEPGEPRRCGGRARRSRQTGPFRHGAAVRTWQAAPRARSRPRRDTRHASSRHRDLPAGRRTAGRRTRSRSRRPSR